MKTCGIVVVTFATLVCCNARYEDQGKCDYPHGTDEGVNCSCLGYAGLVHRLKDGTFRCCAEKECAKGEQYVICREGEPHSGDCVLCDKDKEYMPDSNLSTNGRECIAKRVCNYDKRTKNDGDWWTNRVCECITEEGWFDPDYSVSLSDPHHSPETCLYQECQPGEQLTPFGRCEECPDGTVKESSDVGLCWNKTVCESSGMVYERNTNDSKTEDNKCGNMTDVTVYVPTAALNGDESWVTGTTTAIIVAIITAVLIISATGIALGVLCVRKKRRQSCGLEGEARPQQYTENSCDTQSHCSEDSSLVEVRCPLQKSPQKSQGKVPNGVPRHPRHPAPEYRALMTDSDRMESGHGDAGSYEMQRLSFPGSDSDQTFRKQRLGSGNSSDGIPARGDKCSQPTEHCDEAHSEYDFQSDVPGSSMPSLSLTACQAAHLDSSMPGTVGSASSHNRPSPARKPSGSSVQEPSLELRSDPMFNPDSPSLSPVEDPGEERNLSMNSNASSIHLTINGPVGHVHIGDSTTNNNCKGFPQQQGAESPTSGALIRNDGEVDSGDNTVYIVEDESDH